MDQKPDYDIGDWVICIKGGSIFKIGSKLAVRELIPPGTNLPFLPEVIKWGVKFWGVNVKTAIFPNATDIAVSAHCFRKLDPLVDVPEQTRENIPEMQS